MGAAVSGPLPTRVESSATEAPDISIVVMTYNEVSSLGSVVSDIDGVLGAGPWRYETLIVNDGSTDGSADLAEQLAHSQRTVRTIHHERNLGIGEVYRSGFTAARGTYLTFLPADGQFPAQIVSDFAGRMSDADLVLGRVASQHRSVSGRVLSLGERLMYRLLFGKLPPFQGIMMFRRSLLSDLGIRLGGRGWGVLMEIVIRAKRARLRIVSVVTPLRPRRAGQSKVNNLRSVTANLHQALSLWWRL